MHGYFLNRLVPVCTQLLEAVAASGEIRPDLRAYELMRGVGNLCIGAERDAHYDARRLLGLLIAGLRRPHRGAADHDQSPEPSPHSTHPVVRFTAVPPVLLCVGVGAPHRLAASRRVTPLQLGPGGE
ncbi:hypothetical protein J2Z21_008951 [Streptomyces griseochromogenes]|uniref:Tetracyclin repressor-like C-terminal domain-containing protein n=1 Tax=Streptomyces griseochromogenes TaxID=68214 RepID=A0ABS4M8D0_9ACTN|nr:hypothetical protein [Streptomyces griseochromogenes]